MSKDIIGINIGSKNTIIGTYDKGTFKIILSDISSRMIPTVISYTNYERSFGEIAFNKNRSNYNSTIIYINRWLGINSNFSFFDEEAKYANFPPEKNDNNNLIGFNIVLNKEKNFFIPETIMGAFLNKIKNLWVNNNININLNTNNIVISIPDYSTVQERKSMLDSIYISNLNCTALLHESSAIGINYAFQKMKDLEKSKRTVAFIDLGHSHLNIFFAEFTKKSITILSVLTERFCGARDLDFLIAEKISNDFNIKNNIDLLNIPKAKISLLNTINKIRKNLTVNKEGTITIDEIVKGKDLIYNLTRDNMEEIITPLLLKFESFCTKALTKAIQNGVDINNLYSIEMVGDTLRTPCILKIIKNVFKKDLSKTLIPNECITRGCALFAMMNSPHYKIQNFTIKHYNPYPIFLKCQGKYIKVFSEGDNFPDTKTININRDMFNFNINELIIKFVYQDIYELNFLKDKIIHEYKILIPYSYKKKIIRMELIYELDINCIPKLTNAYMISDNELNILNKEQLNFVLIKENFGLSKEYLDILKSEEIEREKKDLNIKEATAYKNSLEEYIYKTRDNIDTKGELKGYFTKHEKEKLIKEMDKLMKWLYSDSEDLYNKEKLEEKSLEMKNISEPIYQRFNEWKKLKEKIEEFQELITDKIMFYTSLEDNIKKGEKNDIKLNLNDINKIQQIIQIEFNNLELKLYQIENESKNKIPSITSNDVENMINIFKQKIEQN